MIWFKRMNKKNLISTLVSIALLVVFSIAIEGTVTLSGIFSLIFIYAIAALALNIICGCLGEFVLGHGGFVLIGYTIAVKIMQFVQSKMELEPPRKLELRIAPQQLAITLYRPYSKLHPKE